MGLFAAGYWIKLSGTAGVLDSVFVTHKHMINQKIREKLITGDWMLDDGDTITIEAGESEQG